MALIIGTLLALWLLALLVVLATCAAAARGDQLLRESVRTVRDAHWGRLER